MPSLHSGLTCKYSSRPCVQHSEPHTGPSVATEPSLLRLLCPDRTDSAALLQVCISLIKRCLWASCLPSAPFHYGAIGMRRKHSGPVGGTSRFTNLWKCFHGVTGPCWSCCGTHSRVFATAVLPWLSSLVPGLSSPMAAAHTNSTQTLLFLWVSRSKLLPRSSRSFIFNRLLWPSPRMFFLRGQINQLAGLKEGRGRKSQRPDMQL